MLPIITLLVDQVFKINEKRVEERRARQIEYINKAQDLWNDLAEITAEVIYLKELKFNEIYRLKIEIEKSMVKFAETLNARYFEFKNLKDIIGTESYYSSTIITPLSVLECSISSTLNAIINYDEENISPSDREKIAHIQEYIRVIYIGVKAAILRRTINIMKYSMELDNDYDERYVNKIKEEFEYIKEFGSALVKEIYDNYELDGSDDDLKSISNFLKEMKYEENYDPELFRKEFEDLYNKLPAHKKIHLNDIYEFSWDLIERLAYIIKIHELNTNFNQYRQEYRTLKSK